MKDDNDNVKCATGMIKADAADAVDAVDAYIYIEPYAVNQ
jgi:hypothetical protein